jgi:hypothetical protein
MKRLPDCFLLGENIMYLYDSIGEIKKFITTRMFPDTGKTEAILLEENDLQEQRR